MLSIAEIDEARQLMKINPAGSRRLLEGILEKAKSQIIEGMVLRTLAEVNLEQGDAVGGRRQAIDALRIFNGLGLGLRVSRTLCTLANALKMGNQADMAKAYLTVAIERAKIQEYYSCKRYAEELLRDIE